MVRLNEQIQFIVLHHTEFNEAGSVQQLNAQYVQQGQFGLPYDIVIQRDGKIGLGPRWLYAVRSDHVLEGIPVAMIGQFPIHHMAGMVFTDNYYLTAVHVALAGDFNIDKPSAPQLAALHDVLAELQKSIPHLQDLKLHSDIETTSCPGAMFTSYKPTLST